jgi:poly(A) polymerase
MTINKKIETHVIDIIRQLQNAGFSTYLVGGAVRDILLDITPKDYDIATEATPNQIKKVFGKRNTRIIGRRFRIVHLYYKGPKYVEISTFRKAPDENTNPSNESLLITRDNLYGTAYEDAWRRDFSVNSIFYDPVNDVYEDFTENGLTDLKDGTVRSIGEPLVRFSEDPVRVLRALKLVAQYGFKLTDDIEKALPESLEQINLCSNSRLLLELEKICRKPYSAETLRVFKNYGFLKYYLPFIDKNWDTKPAKLGLKLLQEYNNYCKKENATSHYTTSLVLLCIPFVNESLTNREDSIFWKFYPEIEKDVQNKIKQILSPYILSGYRLNGITSSMLLLQKMYHKHKVTRIRLNPFYKSTRDVFRILNFIFWNEDELMEFWDEQRPKRNQKRRSPQNFKRRMRR